MIVVLAGAGASFAVDPDRYPTTAQYLERLPNEIKDERLFKLAIEYLESQGSLVAPARLDIEVVAMALDRLIEASTAIAGNEGFAQWLYRDTRWHRAVLEQFQKFSMEPLTRILQAVQRDADNLRSGIDRHVHKLYGQVPPLHSLEHTWIPFLKGLLDANKAPVELFTTNYDVVIEQAIDNRFPIATGRQDGVFRTLNTALWTEGISELPGVRGLLTKLHGSIDWSREDGEIYLGAPGYRGSHDRHAIIYPGFKGGDLSAPFDQFHRYFETCVAKATTLVIIGYAWRDPHINAILKGRRHPKASIIVLNPEKEFKAALSPLVCHHLSRGFCEESVSECLELAGASKDWSASSEL